MGENRGHCVFYTVTDQGALLNRFGFGFHFNDPAIRLWHVWKGMENEGMLCEWDSHEALDPDMELDTLHNKKLMMRPWHPQHAQVRAKLAARNFPNQ